MDQPLMDVKATVLVQGLRVDLRRSSHAISVIFQDIMRKIVQIRVENSLLEGLLIFTHKYKKLESNYFIF